MSGANTIEHIGIVEKITPLKVVVKIENTSACSSCHAKGICSIPNTSSSLIEVARLSDDFFAGEKVNVLLEKTLGFKALFLGYLLPFIVFLVTLIISSALIRKEILSGVIALAVLIPYYWILFLNRLNLEKVFNFRIEKL